MTDSAKLMTMNALAQTTYIDCQRIGVAFCYKAPNKFYYLYRKNMIEPSLRDKYCTDASYCIWCEVYDLDLLSICDLKVYPIIDNQVAGWVKLIDKLDVA